MKPVSIAPARNCGSAATRARNAALVRTGQTSTRAQAAASRCAAAARALLAPGHEAWTQLIGFRTNAPGYRQVSVAVEGRNHIVDVDPASPAPAHALIDGQRILFIGGSPWAYGVPTSARDPAGSTVVDGTLRSPMPGRVVSVAVQSDQAVVQGQVLLAVEAMKMEHALLAPFAGKVTNLAVIVGDLVTEDQVLARIVKEA